MSLAFFRIMTGTIELNNQLGFCAIKIRYVFSENLLSGKTHGICTQKIIPKMFFLFCHIFA